jgi:DNA-binding CsgD family transcriptional regulator
MQSLLPVHLETSSRQQKTVDIVQSLKTVRRAIANIRSIDDLRDWYKGPVNAAIPHLRSLSRFGRVHALGITTTHVVAAGLPKSYLDGICDPLGEGNSPMLREWFKTRRLQFNDAKRPGKDVDPRWLENFARHGLTNALSFGFVDDENRTACCFCLYDVPQPLQRKHVLLMSVLAPEAHRAFSRATERVEPSMASRAMLHSTLTKSERELLRWLRQGKTNSEIGAALGKSEWTVKTQLQRMFQKIGTHKRQEAVYLADRHGVID